jgi:hypothetical protein
MRLRLIALGAAFLVLVGFNPDALPFMPRARFSDAVVTHWPSALFMRESILDRQGFPLWRETIMAGQPFAANPLNKTAYPLQWLVLFFPAMLHLNIMIVLHLLLAGTGMWCWARSLGLRDEAAALSALAYALTPKLIGHLGAGHLDILYALAWWPWLMWSIHRGQENSGVKIETILRTTLFAALLFLADVRLSLFALSIAAFYEIVSVVQAKSWRRGYQLLPIVPLFFLLTASILVPLVTWQPYLNRADLTLTDSGVFSLEWGHLVGLLLPAHEGNFETLTYLGLPVLVLTGVAITAKLRKHIFWLALICFAILYSLGLNGFLWPLVMQFEPGLLWFRVPSRAWFTLALVMALLAGYGLQYLMLLVERLRDGQSVAGLSRIRLATVAGTGAALISGGFTLLFIRLSTTAGLSVLVVGLALGVILMLSLNGRLSSQFLALILIGLTFADLAWTGRNWLQWRAPEVWLRPYDQLAQYLADAGAARIYSPTYSLEQQVAAAYDLRLFGGVDPFQLSGIVSAVEQGSGVVGQNYSVVLPAAPDAKTDEEISQANRDALMDTQVLAEWDVSHVVAAYTIENERLRRLDTIDGVYIYANRDYEADEDTSTEVVPNWPQDWLWLPDRDTVARLNQLTLTSALVSGASFLLAVSLLALIGLRRNG